MAYPGHPDAMAVYGGFYQWGRKDPRHTFRGAPISPTIYDDRFTTTEVPNSGAPGATVTNDPGKFFFALPYWTTPYENNCDLWGNGQPINTTGNSEPRKGWDDPCPAGWRVPTQHEWALLGNEGGSMLNTTDDSFDIPGTDRAYLPNSGLYWVKVNNGKASSSFSSSNALCGYAIYEKLVWEGAAAGYKNGTLDLSAAAAPEPLLFLPAAGSRYYLDGDMSFVGAYGIYWSSNVSGSRAYILDLNASGVYANNGTFCANGNSVRCIAE
jgi:hypothetical protein